MELIKTVKEIAYLWHIDSIYVKAWRNRLYRLEDNNLTLLIDGELEAFAIYKGDLIYQLVDDKSTIYILKGGESKQLLQDDNKEFSISAGVLVEDKLSVFFTKKDDFIPEGMYLIGIDLNPENVAITNVYSAQIGQRYFNKSNKEVFSYKEDHTEEFKIDISNYGRIIRKHRDTGEVLSDDPNEIDGELFSYKGLLYVPLKGGQLLALDASDGKKAWIWEHDRLGAYGIVDDKIYKQDGKEVFEIDAHNGRLLKSKKFSDEALLIGFHASGPIWVYHDVIVVVDVLSGKICMLDRLSFKVLEFFTINKKLPFDNHAIIWNADKLHILDLENTLHIFERTA